MSRGKVKWYNVKNGYGFIEPEEGGRDIFVHVSAVEDAGIESLKEGQRLEYDLKDNRGRKVAANLRLLSV